jgi:hydrogenase maturation factor HypF (carbamoyltransferase family)
MTERAAIELTGLVQGVGFRPFVHSLATQLDLRGFVQNRGGHVLVDVEGDAAAVATLGEPGGTADRKRRLVAADVERRPPVRRRGIALDCGTRSSTRGSRRWPGNRRHGAGGLPYAFDLDTSNDPWRIEAASVIRGVAADVEARRHRGEIAAAFHHALADAVVLTATQLARRTGIRTIALTGGVFQNARLSGATAGGLRANGMHVLEHWQVPCNDGGLSLGRRSSPCDCCASENSTGKR